jgi:hypothetical protein
MEKDQPVAEPQEEDVPKALATGMPVTNTQEHASNVRALLKAQFVEPRKDEEFLQNLSVLPAHLRPSILLQLWYKKQPPPAMNPKELRKHGWRPDPKRRDQWARYRCNALHQPSLLPLAAAIKTLIGHLLPPACCLHGLRRPPLAWYRWKLVCNNITTIGIASIWKAIADKARAAREEAERAAEELNQRVSCSPNAACPHTQRAVQDAARSLHRAARCCTLSREAGTWTPHICDHRLAHGV